MHKVRKYDRQESNGTETTIQTTRYIKENQVTAINSEVIMSKSNMKIQAGQAISGK